MNAAALRTLSYAYISTFTLQALRTRASDTAMMGRSVSQLTSHLGTTVFPLARLTSPCGRVTLDPLTAADLPALYALSHPPIDAIAAADPNFKHPYFGGFTYGPFATLQDYVDFCQSRLFACPDVVAFVIRTCHEPDGCRRRCTSSAGGGEPQPVAVGLIALLSTVPAHRRTELGHVWYATRYRGTFVGTAAPATLLQWAFEELRFRRVEWKCMPSNVASRGAAKRLGFVYEATFRKFMVGRRGEPVDMEYYGMTDDDWFRIIGQDGVKERLWKRLGLDMV